MERGDGGVRVDAERALEHRAARGVRFVYFCDMSSLQVACVAVFPDGRRVVSGSAAVFNSTLKVWDVATGKCVATLKEHLNQVRCAASACCTTFVICRRCRSWALRCFRTDSTSFLRRYKGISRCGMCRLVNAWRRCKGTRVPCGARRPLFVLLL